MELLIGLVCLYAGIGLSMGLGASLFVATTGPKRFAFALCVAIFWPLILAVEELA